MIAAPIFICANSTAATSGQLFGYVQFYNMNEQYCVSSSNSSCNGARYKSTYYHKYHPLKGARLLLLDPQVPNHIIGRGRITDTGFFLMDWNAFQDTTGHYVSLEIRLDHSSDGKNRFEIHPNVVTVRFFMTSSQYQERAFTLGAPGSSVNARLNTYHTSWEVWNNALKNSNRMKAHFKDVVVRINSPNSTCQNSGSCADGKTIYINNEVLFKPINTIGHEIGHVAVLVSHRDQNHRPPPSEAYCFGQASCSVSWSYSSPEWASVQFNEAIAQHISNMSAYSKYSNHPKLCRSSDGCSESNSYNIESLPSNPCESSNEGMKVINAVRHLWDVYDENNSDMFDLVDFPAYTFLDTIYDFPNGDKNGEKDEPWDYGWFSTSPDDLNGKSMKDYMNYFRTSYITNGTSEHHSEMIYFKVNCMEESRGGY